MVRELESKLEDVPVPYPRSAENFPQLIQLLGMGAGLFGGFGKVRQRRRGDGLSLRIGPEKIEVFNT